MMKRAHLRRLFALTVFLTAATAACAADLVVFCAGAVKPAFSALAPTWTARSGDAIQVTYATAGELMAKIDAGERADLVIMPSEGLDAAAKKGAVVAASKRDLVAVKIGVAVAKDAKLPDLSSEEGVKRAFLGAKSVTYMDPTRGTSGKYIDEVVLPKLGIRDQVRAKVVLGEGGMIAEKVARGEVDIAFQQMTELLPVAGVQVAGELPPSLQKNTVYSGAVMASSVSAKDAGELLGFLMSNEAGAVFAAKGFGKP